ncbi:MAG: fumarate hydratase C-terminal domain-containing protein [Candidatus Heimdallarchaeota archaeon]|nr:fumarate hydratase C-terminal domain-containing protein [Candidatus Heimdallarchaeota archaeon]MCK4253121.1 fumarate hydratase C-terminal domain-containing protein [Candidatus Heimdallarchaeota archaeon]
MEYHLTTPIPPEELKKIIIGDVVYLTGTVVTARDEAHLKALELHKEGKEPPVNFTGIGLFHCGPVMKKNEDDEWIVVAAGPTTSARMEIFQDEFIKTFHPGIIIGKGGMGEKTAKACQEETCIYGYFTGGAALLAADRIKKVRDVFWYDELGMPECLWVYEVEEFGPLTITIDTHGGNFTDDSKKNIAANRDKILQELN